jgi:hypothetical protein
MTVGHKLCEKDCEERENFVKWYFHGMHYVKIDTTFVMFSDETWCQLSGYMNTLLAV